MLLQKILTFFTELQSWKGSLRSFPAISFRDEESEAQGLGSNKRGKKVDNGVKIDPTRKVKDTEIVSSKQLT